MDLITGGSKSKIPNNLSISGSSALMLINIGLWSSTVVVVVAGSSVVVEVVVVAGALLVVVVVLLVVLGALVVVVVVVVVVEGVVKAIGILSGAGSFFSSW